MPKLELTGKYVHVPVDTGLYYECVRRVGSPTADVSALVNDLLRDFLEDTAGDPHVWKNEEYLSQFRDEMDDETIEKLGSPQLGYRWSSLFLPNGTEIKMEYKKAMHHAHVQHERIIYEGKEYSPSELARLIASNTSRNAWRDLWIKRPADRDWRLADDLRRNG